MRIILNLFTILTTAAFLSACAPDSGQRALKEAFDGRFLIGVAVNERQADGRDSIGAALIAKQFSSIVNENCLKSVVVHPAEDVYDFTLGDQYVDFGVRNGMAIIGHALIWHSQLAPWFCIDKDGKNVSPNILKQRMKDHITTLMTRYKGKILGWDVVNEAINDDGSWRNSPFYQILGEEYIPLAFQYAHEADPDAELYLNDYNMYKEEKCTATIKVIKDLQARGLRIDAVGMQGHIGMDYPDFTEFEKAIVRFSEAGVKVMITEFELSALPSPFSSANANISDTAAYRASMNPYPDGFPAEASKLWNDRMQNFVEMLLRHQDVISRFTFWGLSDGDSWKNDWPIFGRTDYPLLFDRNHEPKPITLWMMDIK